MSINFSSKNETSRRLFNFWLLFDDALAQTNATTTKKKKKNCTTFLFLSFSFFFLFFFFYISITPRNLDHRGLLTGTKGDSKIYSTAKYAPASQKYLIPCVVYFGSSGSCRRKSIFPACCLPLFFSFLFSTTINRLMGSRIYFIGEIFVTIWMERKLFR